MEQYSQGVQKLADESMPRCYLTEAISNRIFNTNLKYK